MGIEKISLRTVTLATLITMGVLPIVVTFHAHSQFREAALQSKVESLSRVIGVAAQHAIKGLRKRLAGLNASLQKRVDLAGELQRFRRTGEGDGLTAALDDPFRNGFVGAGSVDLVKLRVYGLDYRLLWESSEGADDLPQRLSRALLMRAKPRGRTESLKTLGDLWLGPEGPLFSLLCPIGGLRPIGYLEIVADPVFNISSTSELVQMPITVISASEPAEASEFLQLGPGQLPMEYMLSDAAGTPILRVVGHEDVEELTDNMRNTQLTATATFVVAAVAVLAIALGVFQRFVLGPMGRIMNAIGHCADNDVNACVNSQGLKEFHALAIAFNRMTLRLRDSLGELQRLSTQDSLTGLANRRLFDEALEREWARAYRHCSEMALLLLDIDAFKAYNDNYGHQAGDECLSRVGKALERSVHRPGDLVARYGGEEFGVILPSASLEGAKEIAERMRRAVRDLGIVHEGSTVDTVITASVGVAVASPRGGVASRLVEAADRALYRAKREGRNRIATEVPDSESPPPLAGRTEA